MGGGNIVPPFFVSLHHKFNLKVFSRVKPKIKNVEFPLGFTSANGKTTVTHPVVNSVPKGWKKTEGAMTAPNGYTWINNGKALFKKNADGKWVSSGERQIALVKTSTYERQAMGGSAG